MILTNNFHHTRVQVNLRGNTFLSPRQVRRAWRALCGIATCPCSDGPTGTGTRGQQHLDSVPITLTACPNGSVVIEQETQPGASPHAPQCP